ITRKTSRPGWSARLAKLQVNLGLSLINAGGRRIGWTFKTANMQGVNPPCGMFNAKDPVLTAFSCDAFQFGSKDIKNDPITIEWMNKPDGAAKKFRRVCFQDDGMVRRKNLSVEYNA
ncbi:Major sperm protein isoform beta, partial [Aphelenchoides avenae]